MLTLARANSSPTSLLLFRNRHNLASIAHAEKGAEGQSRDETEYIQIPGNSLCLAISAASTEGSILWESKAPGQGVDLVGKRPLPSGNRPLSSLIVCLQAPRLINAKCTDSLPGVLQALRGRAGGLPKPSP